MDAFGQAVAVLAYHLWERRGRQHGEDAADWLAAEAELLFLETYEPIVTLDLERIGTDDGEPRCRLCEAAITRTIAAAAPLWPGRLDPPPHATRRICSQCQQECRTPVAPLFDEYWSQLRRAVETNAPEAIDRAASPSLAVLKSMATSFLLAIPQPELDTLADLTEWLANPDADQDARLLPDLRGRIVWGDFARGQAWCSIARRRNHTTSHPYLVGGLLRDGLALELSLPFCNRDDDPEQMLEPPPRSYTTGPYAGLGRVHAHPLNAAAPAPAHSPA